MSTETLFGHIAARHQHPENVATEALAFILGRSAVARRALIASLCPDDVELERDLSFVTQDHGEDGAIPDLVGRDTRGSSTLLVESKFWAGLTTRQPTGYLERLPTEGPGVLAFVAPSARLITLWPELRRRCADAKLAFSRETLSELRYSVQVGPGRRHLVLVSWSFLLDRVEQAVAAASEIECAADVRQLRGLCQRMDDDAFLPLRPEELSPMIPRRTMQFCRLVDKAVEKLCSEKSARPNGRASRSEGRYIRWILLRGNGCSLYYSPQAWATLRETPIWLRVGDPAWTPSADIRATLERDMPARLIATDGMLRVPISLPLGVEESAVIDAICAQVREVADRLPESVRDTPPVPDQGDP